MKSAVKILMVVVLALVAAFFAQPAHAQEVAPLVEVQWSQSAQQMRVTATGFSIEELGQLQVEGGEEVTGCWFLVSADEKKWDCFVDLTGSLHGPDWFGYVHAETQPAPDCVSHHPDWVGGDTDPCWWRRVTPVVTFTGSARNLITATLTGADPRELPQLQVAEDIEYLRPVDWEKIGEGHYVAVLKPIWITGFKLTGEFVECSNHHEWWTLDAETCWMQGNMPNADIHMDGNDNAGRVVIEFFGSPGFQSVSIDDGEAQPLALEVIDEAAGSYYAVLEMFGGEPIRGYHHFFLTDVESCFDGHDHWSPEVPDACWFKHELPTVEFDGYAAVISGHAQGNEAFGYAFRDPSLEPIYDDYRPWQSGSHDWLAGSHSMNPFTEGIRPDNVWEWWMEGVATCRSTTMNWVVVNNHEDGSCSFRVGLNPEAIQGRVFLPILMR